MKRFKPALLAIALSVAVIVVLGNANIKPEWSGNLCPTPSDCQNH